ncbi:uncharacterized protein PHALS_05981 [Plasmopara halstedii]|uniref:Uncharacterized protein n=1 Tax=Plasmopara halstedii TaxID=4781 RepID=A0A0P1AAM8_PLAHL|nr:uncharacterized protein PHALS_05981 [Plasmopara halstedii]CEG37935.1 hypothetical protein PHALS_05981 [Plasmopara halstedii]|eukprot:XP_024574304.1 hypothetical protein PHALS_05981 [Plasmopara halstedii]
MMSSFLPLQQSVPNSLGCGRNILPLGLPWSLHRQNLNFLAIYSCIFSILHGWCATLYCGLHMPILTGKGSCLEDYDTLLLEYILLLINFFGDLSVQLRST